MTVRVPTAEELRQAKIASLTRRLGQITEAYEDNLLEYGGDHAKAQRSSTAIAKLARQHDEAAEELCRIDPANHPRSGFTALAPLGG